MASSTTLDHLNDLEFVRHLYTKENPTREELDAAVRMESLLESYNALLERIHTMAVDGIEERKPEALTVIRDLTAPAEPAMTRQ